MGYGLWVIEGWFGVMAGAQHSNILSSVMKERKGGLASLAGFSARITLITLIFFFRWRCLSVRGRLHGFFAGAGTFEHELP